MPGVTQIPRALARLPRAASLLRQHGRPDAVLYFGVAPGDDLLATAVLRQWRRVHGAPAAYLTNHPGLFLGNPDVAWTAEYAPELAGALRALGVPRRRLKYQDYDPVEDRSVGGPGHFIDLMCASAGLPPTADPVPRIFLTPDELGTGRGVRPRVAVQSSVLSAAMPMRNKEWYPERMQEVVNRLRHRLEVVQLGMPADPPLQGAIDLRGNTVREAAIELARSSVFVGMATFFMHLARAVETPAVIVYGGREDPRVSGYATNVNLTGAVPCAPCWRWNTCAFDRECMQRIDVEQVVGAVETLLSAASR